MGIEKAQRDAIEDLYRGGKPDISPALLGGPGYSPNQRWLGNAIELEDGPAGVDACLSLYATMAKFGHQAVGAGYGNEQGAPDPHSGLWAAAHGYILWWAMKNKRSALLLAALGYWADHVAMCREFWTPAGVRMPCARAIFTLAKGEQTTSPRPDWTIDSRIYALIATPAMSFKAAKDAYGNVSPPDQICWELMAACSSLHKAILAQSLTTKLKLAVPIRRWPGVVGGGFDAAMVEDTPMNDRMSWIVVDRAGSILGSGNTLANFQAPPARVTPDIIGGPGGTVMRPATTIPPISPAAVAAMNAPEPPRPASAAKPARKERWWEAW